MELKEKNVIVRFPPSPTGGLHIGGVRTVLFNYLFAKKNGGKIFLRLEDTDKERSKSEHEKSIIDGLSWLGLKFDSPMGGEGDGKIWRQSERSEIYKAHLKKLIDADVAYISKESEGERAEVVRFKNPNKKVSFTDLVRGEVTFDTTDLGDFVIAKSLEEPLYHLAVVVDDMEMGVTHVIRGEDHISNTPRQILLIEALKFKVPVYAHIPLILAPDRSKLSKRFGATSLQSYRDMGYLSEAIINYLALLGWNPGTPQEVFSLGDLEKEFDLSKVQKGGAVFNTEKLDWFNRHYIQKMSSVEKLSYFLKLIPSGTLEHEMSVLAEKPELIELMSERIDKFSDLVEAIKAGDYDYFFGEPKYDKEKLFWKGQIDAEKTKFKLEKVKELVLSIAEGNFNKDEIRRVVWPYAEVEGRGEVLWPFRVSLSGKDKSPDPFALAESLGRKETENRLTKAINLLS